MEKLCYSAKDLKELLGISLPRVYDLFKIPGFPVVQVSERRFVVPADGLRRWMEENSGIKVG